MGRHEQRVPDRRLDDFAEGLRELRRRAGNPSYDRLAVESGYDSTTLAAAAAGEHLPSLTVTLAYVSACRGDPDAWADRWRRLAAGFPDIPVAPPPRRGPRTVLVLAGLVVLGGAAGVLLYQRAPSEPAPVAQPVPSTVPPPMSSGPPPEYQATTGPGCRSDFMQQTNVAGDSGWWEARGGSSTEDGCDDRYLYSMADNYFQWRFVLDSPATRQCAVEVFVPNSVYSSSTVRYDVTDRFENAEEVVGRFSLDQAANRGKWINIGTVSVTTTEVMVQLGAQDSPVAAGPLRLSCARMST